MWSAQILLLSSAIDYQRVGSRLVSLEPLMMQENEYLKNAVAKIAAFQPDVLLVEKVVSGLAQEFLLDLGVTSVSFPCRPCPMSSKKGLRVRR